MTGSNWVCPHCNRHQAVVDSNLVQDDQLLWMPHHVTGHKYLSWQAVTCANPACGKLTLHVFLKEKTKDQMGNSKVGSILNEWQLLPESSAKPLPDYIPPQIKSNYEQACRICDLSPWASAAMSRRCLQGMIRDFCGITNRTLFQEINELKRRVDGVDGAEAPPRGVHADTVEALDAVREMGNIGAHMEDDVDRIIEVDPGEAQQLINLIELLLEEWYIQRHERAGRISAVIAVNNAKQEARKKE